MRGVAVGERRGHYRARITVDRELSQPTACCECKIIITRKLDAFSFVGMPDKALLCRGCYRKKLED